MGTHTTRMVAVAAGHDAAELDRLLTVIHSAGINLDAYVADDAGVNFFAPDPDRLKDVITDGGFFGQVVDVVTMTIGNKPGALHAAVSSLKDSGVQILSLFGMGIGDDGKLFIRVADVDRAVAALMPN